MHLAPSLRLLACATLLSAPGCGEDAANANICPSLPIYHVVHDEATDTDSLVRPDGQPLSSGQVAAIRDSESKGCTSPIGTALTDPTIIIRRPPAAGGTPGSGGSTGAADGGN